MSHIEHYPIAAEMDMPWPTDALVTHGERVPYAEPIFAAYMESILNEAPPNTPIVELGAGIGYLGSLLPKRHRDHYIQTEIGERNCVEADKRNPDLPTIAARAQELPFQTGSVGAVVARNLFDMVDTPAVIAEVGRVLQPGGIALHMRDHRPSLVWIQKHMDIGKTKRLIPHYDTRGAFQRYQVIAHTALSRFLADQPILTSEEISNPHYQEHMSGGNQSGEQQEILRIVSRLASTKSERTTPTFGDIMDKKLAGWFKKAGFDTSFETFPGVYELPKDYATTVLGWQKNINYRVSESDGYWWQDHDETVPPDLVRISHAFDVVAAIKNRS